MEWQFNPPKASHQSGVWERMVRTIRRVLTGVMEQVSRLTDEVLETLFCEVENQVNGCPITTASDDVNDLEALTLNHSLLLRSNTAFLLWRSIDNDIYRGRWREVQYISDLLWMHWSTEYLPQLKVRTKWIMTRKKHA